MRKVGAEAGKTEAETANAHWSRFQSEITRLEGRVMRLEDELREVHREKAKVETEFAEYRMQVAMAGQGRQTAALVLAGIHVDEATKEAKAKGGGDDGK